MGEREREKTRSILSKKINREAVRDEGKSKRERRDTQAHTPTHKDKIQKIRTHCYRTPFICKNYDMLLLRQTKRPTISRAVQVIVIVSSYGCLMDAYCKCIVRLNDVFFLISQFCSFSLLLSNSLLELVHSIIPSHAPMFYGHFRIFLHFLLQQYSRKSLVLSCKNIRTSDTGGEKNQ